MASELQENTGLGHTSTQAILNILTAHVRLWLLSVSCLMILGFLIIVGPKHSSGPVYISLSPGHAVTTQDALALIPITIAAIWLGIGLWNYRETWQNYMRHSPTKAFLIALSIGLMVGFLMGLPLGVVFENSVRHLVFFIRSLMS